MTKRLISFMLLPMAVFALIFTSCKDKREVETQASFISLNPESLTMNTGDTLRLKATVEPDGWKGKVVYTSSDPTIGTVNEQGLVTAQKEGETVITAKADELTATCKITVRTSGTGNGEELVITEENLNQYVWDYTASPTVIIYKGDKPMIIDIWATWCGPCQMAAPMIKELAKEYAGRAYIGKLDVDKDETAAQRLYKALSKLGWKGEIPCFVMLAPGKDAQITLGFDPSGGTKKKLKDFLDENLKK